MHIPFLAGVYSSAIKTLPNQKIQQCGGGKKLNNLTGPNHHLSLQLELYIESSHIQE